MLDLGAVAAEILRRPPPAGTASRIVAVDGPGGAGKTTFAARLAAELGDAPVVHTDDFASWEEPVDWWPRLRAEVLEPLAAGRPVRFRPTSWDGRPRARIELEWTGVVVLEGVTAARAAFRPFLTYAIWVETPRELRLRRGLERDGEEARPLWERWMAEEDAYAAREHPAERADLVVPGDARPA
jgi:uridine kinase